MIRGASPLARNLRLARMLLVTSTRRLPQLMCRAVGIVQAESIAAPVLEHVTVAVMSLLDYRFDQ